MSTTIITQFNGQKNEAESSSSRPDNVYIEVGNPITHGEGKDKYTDYEVKVQPNAPLVRQMDLETTSVRRRYNDFVWLYNELNSQRLELPKLPNKQWKVSIIAAFNKKNFEENFIKHRAKQLEKFVNKLAANPLAQSNRSFKLFLQAEHLNSK